MAKSSGAAKQALAMHRISVRKGIKYWAREFSVTVSQIHEAAGCVNGEKCCGGGCRV